MRAVVRWLLSRLFPGRRPHLPPPPPPPPTVTGTAPAPTNWRIEPERGPAPETHEITWRDDFPPPEKHRNDGRWEDQP